MIYGEDVKDIGLVGIIVGRGVLGDKDFTGLSRQEEKVGARFGVQRLDAALLDIALAMPPLKDPIFKSAPTGRRV